MLLFLFESKLPFLSSTALSKKMFETAKAHEAQMKRQWISDSLFDNQSLHSKAYMDEKLGDHQPQCAFQCKVCHMTWHGTCSQLCNWLNFRSDCALGNHRTWFVKVANTGEVYWLWENYVNCCADCLFAEVLHFHTPVIDCWRRLSQTNQ